MKSNWCICQEYPEWSRNLILKALEWADERMREWQLENFDKEAYAKNLFEYMKPPKEITEKQLE